MTRQYLRRVSLVVGSQAGDALDLSDLRVTFKVRQWDLQTPNNAVIRVWNPADKTAEQVRREYTRVVLQAGYEGGTYGKIFEGTIVQAKKGRANAIDTYLDIVAADGDEAYNFSVVNKTLAAGSSAQERVAAVVGSMNDHGVSLGYVPPLSDQKLPRAKVMFGMARDNLRQLGITLDTKWSIQLGKVQMIPLDGVIPGPIVKINAASGMIGIPEQTEQGIMVKTLLNSEIVMGRMVEINNADINQAQLAVSLQGQVQNYFLPRVADDGLYRVISADHEGDNRANEFYTSLVCIAIGDPVTKTLSDKGYG